MMASQMQPASPFEGYVDYAAHAYFQAYLWLYSQFNFLIVFLSTLNGNVVAEILFYIYARTVCFDLHKTILCYVFETTRVIKVDLANYVETVEI